MNLSGFYFATVHYFSLFKSIKFLQERKKKKKMKRLGRFEGGNFLMRLVLNSRIYRLTVAGERIRYKLNVRNWFN